MPVRRTPVAALVIDPARPSTLYAGLDPAGVFKSTDGGTSSTAANTGLADVSVSVPAIDPVSPTTVYAGSSNSGRSVFKSTDGGASWAAANTGLGDAGFVSALAIDPTPPTALFAGTTRGVFRSTDGGTSWSPFNTGLTDFMVLALAVAPTDPTTVYAGTEAGGVFAVTTTTGCAGTGTFRTRGRVRTAGGVGSRDSGRPLDHQRARRLRSDGLDDRDGTLRVHEAGRGNAHDHSRQRRLHLQAVEPHPHPRRGPRGGRISREVRRVDHLPFSFTSS
jgi:hypothetical protein